MGSGKQSARRLGFGFSRAVTETLEARRLLASVSGVVYKDVDGNGVRSAADTLVPGYTVNVYTGADYRTATLFRSVNTDSNGAYSVTDLPDGVYATVQPVHPAGYTYTDVSSSSWTTSFNLTQNFGVSDRSVFRGYVFTDLNQNGVRDANESSSVSGTLAYLDSNNDGTRSADEPSAVTQNGGGFYIGNIGPGTYTFRIIPPAGYTQTAPTGGGVTAFFDTNPSNRGTSAFGIYSPINTSTISGYSFNDTNGDGVRQENETRNAGRTVYVDSNVNGLLDADETSAKTDADGLFTLTVPNVNDSTTYYVREVIPADYHATTQINTIYYVTLKPGETIAPVDVFGSNSNQYVVTGTVFTDNDGHGVYDTAVDVPVAGRTVYADLNYDGRLSTGEPSFVTGDDGAYKLTFGKPGNYAIGQVLPAGLKSTRTPSTSTASPYAYLTDASPTALLNFGSRPVANTLSIDNTLNVWTPPAQDSDAGGGRVTLLADGGWLVATAVYSSGNSYIRDTLRRFTANGALDTTFGTAGVIKLFPGEGTDILEQPDGKLLVAGTTFGGQYGIIRRFTANGIPDTGFGTNGVVNNFTGLSQPTFVGQIALAADGDILVGSASRVSKTNQRYVPTVTRLTAAGARVASFGTDGTVQDTRITRYGPYDVTVAVTPDGGVLVRETESSLLKLTAAGQIDTAFGDNGEYIPKDGTSYVTLFGMRVQADGKILLTGSASRTGFLARVNADGTPDVAFGQNGMALLPRLVPVSGGVITPDTLNDVLVLPDGSYFAVGAGQGPTEVYDLLVARFDANGTLNADTFTGGRGTYALSAAGDSGRTLALAPDGRVRIGATTLDSDGAAVVRLPVPTVTLPATLTVAEGGTLGLTARASEFGGRIVNYAWDFDYDGRTFAADADGVSATFDATGIDGPATRQIALRVRDANGFYAMAVRTVTITNAAPTAGPFGSSQPTTPGKPALVGFGGANDTGAADRAAGLKYSFDFNNDGDFTDAGDVADSVQPFATYAYAAAGSYTVRGRVSDKDGGYTDYTTTVQVNPPTPVDPASVTLEAETATLAGGTAKGTGNAGYTGTGFADFGGQNSSAQWTLKRNAAGAVSLGFRYANGSTANRPLTIYVNGVAVGTVACAPTGSWATWKTVSIAANLLAGSNSIKAVASSSAGGANVDSLTVASTVTPTPGTGTVSGFVFDDADKDGVYDAGETRPAGHTVYVDLNNNGLLDGSETGVLTGVDGAFGFTNLAAGTVRIRTVLPAGTAYSTPFADVTLTAGQTVTGVVIGTKSTAVTPPPTGTGSISGTAFNDNNANARYDTGDGASKSVSVFLDLDNDGVLDTNEKSVLTDSSGKFTLSGLAAGTYSVRRVFAAGYTSSTAAATITLTSGQAKTGVLLGSKKV